MYKITDIFKKLILDIQKSNNLKYYYTRENNSNFKTEDIIIFNKFREFAEAIVNRTQSDALIKANEAALFKAIITNRINFYYIYNNNQDYSNAITNINMVLGALKDFYASINEQSKYFNNDFELNLDAFDDEVKENAKKRIEEIYKFDAYQLPQEEEGVRQILSKYNLI